jgi:NADH-quinone oxidoreductase subunit N
MIFGAFAALVEKRLKRFLAYSSINQIGLLLMGIAAGTFYSLQAAIIYLVIYILMNMGLFIIILNAYYLKTRRPLTYLTDFTYLAKNNRAVGFSVIIIFFSMAGIPPLAGFFGKYYLFLSVFQAGYYSLVLVALLTTMITTYYYLRVIKFLFGENVRNILFSVKLSISSAFTLYTIIAILIFFMVINPTLFGII